MVDASREKNASTNGGYSEAIRAPCGGDRDIEKSDGRDSGAAQCALSAVTPGGGFRRKNGPCGDDEPLMAKKAGGGTKAAGRQRLPPYNGNAVGMARYEA